MNRTADILLALVQEAMGWSCDGEWSGESIAWSEVFRLAQRQGVLAIVWSAMHKLADEGKLTAEQMPDKALKLQWALSAEKISSRYRRQKLLIEKLAKFYAEHGIKMMLLKGYSLSIYYPTPEYRECGDIDIWLYGEQQKADRLLNEHKGVEIDEDKHHHTTFIIDGIMVENHYDFLNVHAHPSNKDIEQELQRLSKEDAGTEHRIGDAIVMVPPANLNALFLLRHAAAHFAAVEIGLRHIIDWALFVKNNNDNIDWSWLYGVAKRHNMEKFLNCLNAISIEYFGLDSKVVPEFERNAELEHRVFNDIISPEFSEKMPSKGIVRRLIFRYRRWWANRWKHRIVYREGLLRTFIVQIYSHLLKPKSLK